MKSKGKEKMYLALSQNSSLIPYMLYTEHWSKWNFFRAVSKCDSIVVKPNDSLKARNVYFISRAENKYIVQINDEKFYFPTREKVFDFIAVKANNIPFIIQEYINLAKIEGRPFVARVITQRRTTRSPWVATAYKFRVAGEGKMVTNASQSTSILSYYEAAEKWSLPPSANLLERLKSVAVLAAEALTWHYPNKRIFGIDIGITEEGTIYIVEINRKPLLKGFSENQQRKVRKYQRNKANKRRK